MRRPVWLFSMDSEGFRAPPLTTGALKAHFLRYGRTAAATDVELVHFLERDEVDAWLADEWPARVGRRVAEAVADGVQPVFGLSFYTWNAAEFLALARSLRSSHPAALVVAGGPHVQRAEDFLHDEAIDVVVLGEGEPTFTQLLDAAARDQWQDVAGLAYLDAGGAVRRTAERRRETMLDRFPSALDVVPLRDARGRALYRQAAYETSRGCPYRCAFCEWGTGAIGTKMYQLPLERVRRDFERLVEGGVEDIWLCDSNFGALREDVAKAEMIVELRRRTGLPRSFATSWSKNHNRRVHDVVRLLHRNGLLSHYHLALQTLTPRALEISHRTNMRANDYEPIVRQLAAEGIPVAGELIWGLPGETLADFESNLDHLMTVFPNVNIFAYTLLPGTELYERREEYRLVTEPVAGYGKAKGEYVVGSHSYTRDEGEEGYLLITAYIILFRGQILPLTARFLALRGLPVGGLLRALLRTLIEELAVVDVSTSGGDRLEIYERRSEIYVRLLRCLPEAYALIYRHVDAWLAVRESGLRAHARRLLDLDAALCPRPGGKALFNRAFDFAAADVLRALEAMADPGDRLLEPAGEGVLGFEHPGGAGEVLLDPDGGAWWRGRWSAVESPAERRRA